MRLMGVSNLFKVLADPLRREILVLRAADAEAAQRVRDRVEAYLERRRKETNNYLPEAYKLLMAAKESPTSPGHPPPVWRTTISSSVRTQWLTIPSGPVPSGLSGWSVA